MPDETAPSGSVWQARQVYGMAVVCLLVGLAIGYLFRGSQSSVPPVPQASVTRPAAIAGAMGQLPGLEQMKLMADKKAEPLLAKLKSDPNNSGLLLQVGNIYKATHQFKDAIGYYDRALKADSKNILARNEMASCLYYTGDVDGALAQLEQSIKDDPKNADALFNLGVIKFDAKKDAKGAVAAWQQLLKSNPELDSHKKAEVRKAIAGASKG
ncbi:MAG: tetratricopeptide repeat protein [Acidobacteriia bacterium]|nr:tetratricopeptide repeat protein [Terriglobia bacterium]